MAQATLLLPARTRLVGQALPDDVARALGRSDRSDADAGENHFNAQNDVAGTYGSFSIDANGFSAGTPANSEANGRPSPASLSAARNRLG